MPRFSRRDFTVSAMAVAASASLPAFAQAATAPSAIRTLGKGGPKVSAVGLGCNNFGMRLDFAGAQAVIDKAVELGVTLFDTADVYGKGVSEDMLGKALGKRRKDVVIATKFGNPMGSGPSPEGGGSRAAIMYAAEQSLKRLGTDYIDLYQIHNPDPKTPLEETMRAMDDLVRQGKVRAIGHSNFTGALTIDAAKIAAANKLSAFVSAQNQYSLLTRDIEKELVPACEANGVGILPYFPLESGMLTGKYKRGEKPAEGTRLAAWSAMAPAVAERFLNDDKLSKVEKLEALSLANGNTLLDMAFGWLLSKSYIGSVIAGATKPEQIAENVKAAQWRPSAEVSAKIDAITTVG